MRIAIVGAGISGLVAAYLLHRNHEITVFEAGNHVGGHTNTIEVDESSRSVAVDTGFIVFNRRNYPNFCRLLEKLGVASQPSSMSFSVRDEHMDLEYGGSSLNSLFAQRRNLLRPSFHRMVRDIFRFYREAASALQRSALDLSLGEFLDSRNYSSEFVRQHIIPMGAAIWSSGAESVRRFPARFFLEFFANHGMLQLRGRPQWRTIRGGSREYVKALTHPFRDRIHLRKPVQSVERDENGVHVRLRDGEQRFEKIILACHSDQSLRLLQDASPREREILGAIPYQSNDTVLHTDASLMPRSRRAWASWNYNIEPERSDRVTMTYYMNRLQNLGSERDYCVTLNRDARIAPDQVLERFVYDHPVYTARAVRAREEGNAIQGVANTYYCGAYWGHGFHEDGVNSALAVCKHFGKALS